MQEATMQPRLGFARLMPLMALTGLAGGTMALLASARPVQSPEPAPPPLLVEKIAFPSDDGGCSGVAAPVPAHGIVDAHGREWNLADIPGHIWRGLDLRRGQWAGANLRGATFVGCDFRGC